MGKSKSSIIWKIDSSELQSIVNRYDTYKEVLAHFGFESNNFRTLQRRLAVGDIDATKLRRAGYRNNVHGKNKRELSEVLVENSDCSRTWLKHRLIKEGYLVPECSECSLTVWRGHKISLELDHINGVSNDNRITNLRLMCPNCHSCTETFSGRNTTKRKKRFNCSSCGAEKKTSSPLCLSCMGKKRRKVDRPTITDLQKLIDSGMSMVKIGKLYGVSDNAVRKWLR